MFRGLAAARLISTAHRGQQRTHSSITSPLVPGAGDPQLTTEGIGRADVWVFSATTPGSGIGGLPLRILTFFSDTPRALATDGTTVYLAAFHSGNRTTVVNQGRAGRPPARGLTSACGGSCQARACPARPPTRPARPRRRVD